MQIVTGNLNSVAAAFFNQNVVFAVAHGILVAFNKAACKLSVAVKHPVPCFGTVVYCVLFHPQLLSYIANAIPHVFKCVVQNNFIIIGIGGFA